MNGETDYERRMSDFKCVELGEKIGYKKGFEAARKQFERPQGEWIPKQMIVGGNGAFFMHDGFECKCGRVVTQKENYCPECGAKMGGDEE